MENDYAQRIATRALLAKLGCVAVILGSIGLFGVELSQLTGAVDIYNLSPGVLSAFQIIGVGYTVAFVIGVIVVAMWIHRAHDNLRRADLDGEFTPGWAVGWYFIPFANLVKPYQAMRELWNRSMGNLDAETVETPAIMPIWWGSWLGANFLSNISTRLADTTDIESYRLALTIGVVGDLLTILAASLLLLLIIRITRVQAEGMGYGQVFA